MNTPVRLTRNIIRETLLRKVYPRGLFRTNQLDFHEVGDGPAIISMCLWNRPTHFRTLLEDLAAQHCPDGIILGLWNNDRSLAQHYETEIERWSQYTDTGALRRIHLTHSPINTGGAGRFFMARKLAHRYRQPSMIFLDDDQTVGPNWVQDLLGQAAPRTQKSWWAWHIDNDDYWDRTLANPGEYVDYAATCGMITDADILDHPKLFRDLPSAYWFIEDVWLNHVALLDGYRLVALETEMGFVLEETNQNHQLASAKPDFYRSLLRQRQHR